MKTISMIVLAMLMTTGPLYAEATGPAPPLPAEEQPEVLTRGPVNEAFAQPVNLVDQTGLTAPSAPPASIEEVPPPERPSGEQFAWVPGYWSQSPGGWQWVAGFWSPAGNNEIEYLPPPPALADVEPPGPPPSPDQIWVPPCWYWNQGQYVQRRGYWLAAQADWVWVPSSYLWTPRGYVTAVHEQQRPTELSPREAEQHQADRMTVRTPPVTGQQSGDFFRKKPPSRPAEEQQDQRGH